MHPSSSSIAAANAAPCALSAASAGWPAETSANGALNLQRPQEVLSIINRVLTAVPLMIVGQPIAMSPCINVHCW